MFIANNSIFKSIIQYFFSQINCAEGVLANDEFRKKFIVPFLKYPLKCKFEGQTLTKFDLFYLFFQEICSSGGKQTTHKDSAAFIVKNCHPRKSLILFHTGLVGTFSPEGHSP